MHFSSAQLPNAIDKKSAIKAFIKQRNSLRGILHSCITPIADQLYSEDLIPLELHRSVTSATSDSRVTALVLNAVESRIKIVPADFKKFVCILESEPYLEPSADGLVQSYCELIAKPPVTPEITDLPSLSPAISYFADHLKRVYKTSPVSPDKKWPPTPSKKFINLAVVRRGQKSRDECVGHLLQGDVQTLIGKRDPVTLEQVLEPDEDEDWVKSALIEGAPGIGKSTLAWELCRKWEEYPSLKRYKLVVLLRLREKRVQKIKSVEDLFYSCPRADRRKSLVDEVLDNYGEGILFVLDGFDELPVTLQNEGFLTELIEGEHLPACTVLVTSRPSASAKIVKLSPQAKRIEVLGFTEESVREYSSSIFEGKELSDFMTFISASKNPAINSLMYVPLNAAIVVEIYRSARAKKGGDPLPITLTALYLNLCLTILNRYLDKNSLTQVNEFNGLSNDLLEQFFRLSKIAYDGIVNQEVIFHSVPSDLIHFGFLDAVTALYGGGAVSHNFLHLTVQEFLAAFHISQLSTGRRRKVFGQHGEDGRWNMVWRFVSGLTKSTSFFELYRVNDQSIIQLCISTLPIHCVFEAQTKFDWKMVSGSRYSGEIDVHIQWPLDAYALGYCIAHCTSTVPFWNMIIQGDEQFDSLTWGLKTNEVCGGCIRKLYIHNCSGDLTELQSYPLQGTLMIANCDTNITKISETIRSMVDLKTLYIHGNQRFDTRVEGYSSDCDVLSVSSSLLVLELFNVNTISLPFLESNTSLMYVSIVNFSSMGFVPHELVKVLEHNKTLQHLRLGTFDIDHLPSHYAALKDIVNALQNNYTLQHIELHIRTKTEAFHHPKSYQELNVDSRITWIPNISYIFQQDNMCSCLGNLKTSA